MRIHAVTAAGTTSAIALTAIWCAAGSGTATCTTHKKSEIRNKKSGIRKWKTLWLKYSNVTISLAEAKPNDSHL
jgi:hypothetical protein